MSRNRNEGVPKGAPFTFAQRENAVGGTSELRANYEQITSESVIHGKDEGV